MTEMLGRDWTVSELESLTGSRCSEMTNNGKRTTEHHAAFRLVGCVGIGGDGCRPESFDVDRQAVQ